MEVLANYNQGRRIFIPKYLHHINFSENCVVFKMFGRAVFELKFMFSKKATKFDEIFIVDLTYTYLVNVKSTVKISSTFVTFLEKMNFTSVCFLVKYVF